MDETTGKNAVRLAVPPDGEVAYVWASRAQEVMVFRHGNAVHAVSAICPHMGARLAVDFRRGVVHCPWHGLEGSLPALQCPHHRFRQIKRYPFREVDGGIEITG